MPPIEKHQYEVDANHNLSKKPADGYIGGAIRNLGGAGLTDMGRWEYKGEGRF